MTYLELAEVLELHDRLIERTGGLAGVRDLGQVESALAQPQMTFAGVELYPNLADKAAALAFSLIQNHPFVDGNKRIGHAAMEVFLVCNGFKLNASIDEQEAVILAVAAGQMYREAFTDWVKQHIILKQ